MSKVSIAQLVPISVLLICSVLSFKLIPSIGTRALTLEDTVEASDKQYSDGARQIFKGEQINGTFRSSANNLGIIEVKFNTFGRVNKDKLVFRIKRTDQDNWYYTNTYNTDQFQNQSQFPFGFPVDTNSKDKIYYFEIESTNGTADDSVALSNRYPAITARQVFTKTQVFKNPLTAVAFIAYKIINIFDNPYILISLLIFFTPLIYYVVYEIIENGLVVSLVLFGTVIFLDIYFSINSSINYLLVFFGLIIHLLKFPKLTKYITLISSALIVFYLVFLNFADLGLLTKLVEWSLLFMAVAIVSQFIIPDDPKKEYLAISQIRLKPKEQLSFVSRVISSPAYFVIERVPPWLIRFIGNIFVFGITFCLLAKTALTIINSYTYYASYFINNQSRLYITGTMIWLVLLLSFYLPASIIVFSKSRKRSITALILAFILLKTSSVVIDISTPFKSKIVIWTISPQSTQEPWVDINVNGRNFGDKPFVGKIYIEDVDQRVISWSNNNIVFRTDPTKTKTGEIRVEDYRGRQSNRINFVYTGGR